MNSLAAHPFAHELGWTLLHFCWQGAAVALLLWCVLGAIGSRASHLRYVAACTALALMVTLPLMTFVRLAIEDYRNAALARAPTQMVDILVNAAAGNAASPWTVRLSVALDRAMPLLLAAWCIGVICFLARLSLGLLAAHRLRTDGTAVPADLQRHFDDLCTHIGIARVVRLLNSAHVDAPTVVGWLRPAILLPASCLTGLAPGQIEAILCHELAHIRRHDYLVSVFQSVVETLLFYHPAVWWVSRQIRRERECCCDEFAVSAGGDVLAYARALSYLEEQRSLSPQLALGANGGVLKMRIQRLLSHNRNSTASQFASIAVLVLLAVSALAAAGRIAWAESHGSQPAFPVAQSDKAASKQQGEPGGPPLAGRISKDANPDDGVAEAAQLRNDMAQLAAFQQGAAELQDRAAMLSRQETDYHDLLAQAGQQSRISDEERERLEDAARRLADTMNAWADQFTHQLADRDAAMARFNSPEFQRQMADATARINSADFKKQMANAQAAMAAMKAENFGQQMAAMEAMKQRLNSEEMLRKIEGAKAAMAAVNAAQLQKQMDAARAAIDKVNTPELRRQMEEAAKAQARLNSPELRKQMEAAAAKAAQSAQAELYQRTQPSAAEPQLYVENAAPAATEVPSSDQQPAQPNPIGTQRVSSGVMQSLVISQPPPVYPAEAKAAHVQGAVVLRAIISKEGTVTNLRVVSGAPMLVRSAMDAVQKWTYHPFLLNGQPVEVDTTINVNYTYGGDGAKPSPPDGPGASAAPAPQEDIPSTDAEGQRVWRIGAGVSAPVVVHNVPPEFSDEAKARVRLEGKDSKVGGPVLVQLIVNTQGQPENVHIVRGVGMGLDEKAIEAVKQYRFSPAMANGQPVPVALNVEVNFKVF